MNKIRGNLPIIFHSIRLVQSALEPLETGRQIGQNGDSTNPETFKINSLAAAAGVEIAGVASSILATPTTFSIPEYDSAGTLARRYVHSDNADDPVVQYAGASVGAAYRTFLMPDERGSVAGLFSNAGASLAKNSYDEYGIPGAANQGRFQYTGQIWLPELGRGVYYYKARIYSAPLGRFLQVDPIGYEDQVNLYAYVGNDPANGLDSTGMCTASADATKETAGSEICQEAKNLNLSGNGAKNMIGFENVNTKAYKVGSDVATIGIGHTDGVKLGDSMTGDQIVDAFVADVGAAEGIVENLVGDLPVSQQEFDALVDLAFNVGQTKLNESNSPGLNQAIADGDYGAIGANLRYTRGPDGPSPGLVARSDSRQAIFNRGDYSQGVNRYNALLRRLRGN